MPIKHRKTSLKANSDDVSVVRPIDWNEDHEATGLIGAIIDLGVRGNTFPYLDADQSAKLSDLTAFARGLLALSTDSEVRAALGAAPLVSPHFSDIPTAPTAGLGVATQQIATMAALQNMRNDLVNSAPGVLDTLKELADALGDDPNFATTVTASLAGKQPLATVLTNMVALVTSADKAVYFTGTNVPALMTFTAFARTLVGAVNAAAARTTLGLGTVSVLDAGTAANNAVQLDGAGKMPAVDGSALTNVVAAGSAPRAAVRSIIAADTIVSGDEGKLLLLNGNFTLGVTAVATLGARFAVKVRNIGTTAIPVDPNAAELIDGLPLQVICPGESCEIICTGTALYTVGLSAMPMIQKITAANSAAVIFSTIYNTIFSDYEIVLETVIPSAGGGQLCMQGFIGGSLQSSASDYDCEVWRWTTSGQGVGGDTGTLGYMNLTVGDVIVASGFPIGLSGSVRAFNMGSGGAQPRFTWNLAWAGSGFALACTGAGAYRGSTAMDGIRFASNTGNIGSGVFKLIGRRKVG